MGTGANCISEPFLADIESADPRAARYSLETHQGVATDVCSQTAGHRALELCQKQSEHTSSPSR